MIDRLTWSAPPSLADAVRDALARWDRDGNTRRLWERDATLWTGAGEDRWLGWLDAVTAGRASLPTLEALAADLRQAGFTHALLLGMGGSSLCPEVLARTFGRQPGAPELHVLDSTDPAQVLALEGGVDLDRTIVIVASKSGSTLEPNVFMRYFFERVASAHDRARAGRQFIAITDPGSSLEQVARADGFRHIVHGEPTIGGRYSALSPFGLVPAAVMGLDVGQLLTSTQEMVDACGADVPAAGNPGVQLGVLLGVCATHGHDKLTIVTSPGLVALGAWLEQLVAESTGKAGRAIIPVDLETPGEPGVYGTDRVFVYVRLADRPDPDQDRVVKALEAAGHIVARIDVPSADAIGQEFFRWEIATAVAGAIIGINPFDQPDVEASKVATRALTAAYERDGRLPAETPIASEDGLALFTDPKNAKALLAAGGGVDDILRAHLARLRPNDYFAVLAYVEMNARHTGVLQRLRHHVRDRARVATCLGFGPRFLHSTGQAYKGGPDSGVFLQITCDDARDVPVPGQRYTFGVVKAAQARGDFDVLAERGRRALRVHVGEDVAAGLERLAKRVARVL
ncbi:MAG TPA: bifunctional transaldolase/phosoglucose isomerase [Vicinamibacterales bacterium]